MAAAKKSSGPRKKGPKGESSDVKLIAQNRKARYEYTILETFEAGMALTGSEVKSLRAGRASLVDSYAEVRRSEVILRNLHISPYEQANLFNHEPTRPRRLLMHKKEIRRLIGKTAERGLTLVPLRLYFKRGWAKCELALAKGKKLHDKRDSKAERDVQRKLQQAMRGGMRRHGSDD
jgi:SsrA-binding protein